MKKRVLRGGVFIFVLAFLILIFANFSFAEDAVLGKISMLCGLTNGHSTDGTIWATDPDCTGGCNTISDPVSYCKKFWTGTTKVTPFDASLKGTGLVFNGIPPNCNVGLKPGSAVAEYNCVGSATPPPPTTHKACVNQQCVEVSGAGDGDECTSNLECAPQQTCNNNLIEGSEVCDGTNLNGKDCPDLGNYNEGTLRCNADCQGYDFSLCTLVVTPPATHQACVNQKCVEVSGAGEDLCTSDLICAPSSVCGNGWKDDGEQCDDGDTVSGDGCNSQCNLEKPVGLMLDNTEGKVTLTWRHYEKLFSDLSSPSGQVVFEGITGNAIADGEEKTGFFQKILNFFKWLFGMKTVGAGIDNEGYVIYRADASDSFAKIGFVSAISCSNNICSYEDDVSSLENGDYSYSFSLKLGGVEGEKSNPIKTTITKTTTPPIDTTPPTVTTPECASDEDCGAGEICDSSGVCIIPSSGANDHTPLLNPPIGIGNKNVQAGQKLSFLLKGYDEDGNRITYSVKKIRFEDWSETDVTSGLSLNADTGQVTWDTTTTDIGHYIFKFTVSDGESSSSEIVYTTVYAAGTQMCNYEAEGLSAPYGACFEKKPLYCDPVNGARYNCSDCGCYNAANTIYLCESSGSCVEPYDCQDIDGDGTYGVSTGCPAEAAKDCDDTNPNVNPSAVEICGDGIDNNCNEQIDEAGCKGADGA